MVYHLLNRGVGRMRLFRKAADFAAMEKVLEDALKRTPAGLLAYFVLSNHWHIAAGREPMASCRSSCDG